MFKEKKKALILIAIIVVQLVVILYWALAKQNYFIDELYSMGYASSYTGNGDTARYITTSDDFKFNEWVANFEYKKYLLLSDDESLFSIPFYKAVWKMLTGKNYFGLLNIAESIYGYDQVSHIPAIILNAILFILTELFLIKLLKKMNVANEIQLLSVGMFGFSSFVIGHVMYIRFYILVMMFQVFTLILIHKMWTEDSLKKFILNEIIFMLVIYLMFKNSQFTVIYFGSISIFLVVGLLLTKQRLKAVLYCLAVAAGGLYALFRTEMINIIFHPNNYIREGESTNFANIALNLQSPSMKKLKDCVSWLKELFRNGYFGNWTIVFGCLAAITIYLALKGNDEKSKIYKSVVLKPGLLQGIDKEKLKDISIKIKPITIIALMLWIFIWIRYRGTQTISKMSLIVMVCLIAYTIIESAGKKIKFDRKNIDQNASFIFVLIGATTLYTLFIAFGQFRTARYYCFGFVMVVVAFWYVADRLIKRFSTGNTSKGIYRIIAVCVLISAIIPFGARQIDYLNEDDAKMLNALYKYNTLDVLLVIDQSGDSDLNISRHETYDCVNLMSEDSNIYAVNISEYEVGTVDFPEDDFVLWSHSTRDISSVMNDLTEHGYVLESLGTDHCSQAYVCRKE